MGLEVPCMLNPRWSAGCPDRARSNSEGYVEGFQLGKLRVHNPCMIVPDLPYSLEGPGQQGILQLTLNQIQVSHCMSVKSSLNVLLDKVNISGGTAHH